MTVDEDGQVWEKSVHGITSGTDYIGARPGRLPACPMNDFWNGILMNPGGAAMFAADGQGNGADIEQFSSGH